MSINLSRRGFVLRGLLGGATVTVGLPLLEFFLDANGKAFAANVGGGPLPVRFGTWFWGCGMIPSRWVPKTTGTDYDLPPQLAPIAAQRQHINILSGFNADLGARNNQPHISGATALRTGASSDNWQQIAAPTFDVLIADAIGSGTYFRSLELTTDGNPRTSYSYRTGSSMNASTPSAVDLYTKIFGADFHDPNSATFKPDPKIMVRKSVLSSVSEQRKQLQQRVSSGDRARLDQYFTSLREVEQKLALQLQKPPPALACSIPQMPKALPAGADYSDVDVRTANHRAMSQLLVMALACNQTRVFNMVFSEAASDLRHAGNTTAYHQSTHEELIDRKIGYQPTVDVFATQSMAAWADFVAALAAVPEGDGSLLDNTLVFAHSDVSMAKNHDVNGIPMMTAGRAGGRIRTGLHIAGNGSPVTRAGL
ncbi:MAG TPA: DUF1552 domain-containing protein, partial [Spongiibacteraceae bacterium]|nr:DUF1552 domain-containing protein [Spongiibacteraceae bacterium]